MTKLKTLKDLKVFKRVAFPSSIDKREFINLEELKAEAILWVKHMLDSDQMEARRQNTNLSKSQIYESVICTQEWIKIFFNITSEDLE